MDSTISPFDSAQDKPHVEIKDTRVCAQCRRLFEVQVRSYKRFCVPCRSEIAISSGKRGGRPRKHADKNKN